MAISFECTEVRASNLLIARERMRILLSLPSKNKAPTSVSARRLFKKIVDVGDPNGQTRHQHRTVVTNQIRLQHPSSTVDVQCFRQ